MYDVVDDTIVAVATAAGFGARGIVRVSGPEAGALVLQVTQPLGGEARSAGKARDGGGELDLGRGFRRLACEVAVEEATRVPGEVYWFRGPASYTGQDSAEFHVPGSPVLLNMLVERLIALGARAAEPGEFSARAVVCGRMNLAEAEAVSMRIAARSDAQLGAARRLAGGAMARAVEKVCDALAALVSLVEAEIDFSEEGIAFISGDELAGRVAALTGRLREIQAAGVDSERLAELPRVLLLGAPNAGKSTLMNRLSGQDRAICTPVAGATRDFLSAVIRVGSADEVGRGGGMEAELLDSAGVPEGRHLAGAGGVGARWSERMVRAGAEADVVVWVVDGLETGNWKRETGNWKLVPFPKRLGEVSRTAPLRSPACATHADRRLGTRQRTVENQLETGDARLEIRDKGRTERRGGRDGAVWVAVVNKVDVMGADEVAGAVAAVRACGCERVCAVSGLRGDGVDGLRAMLGEVLRSEAAGGAGEVNAVTARHRSAMAEAVGALERCAGEVARDAGEGIGDRTELVAFGLREALEALGTITGRVTTEDLLGRVFSSFCIGK